MGGFGFGGMGGGGSGQVRDRTIWVGGAATGVVRTISFYSGPGGTWSKLSGNANITISAGGAVSVGSAIGAGNSQTAMVQVVKGNRTISFQLTVAGIVTAPAQVGTVTPTPSDSQVTLAWSAPSNGGSAITDYKIEFKPSAGSTWVVFSDGVSGSTGAVVTGLTNGTPYDFRVSPINVAGTGASSTPVSATPTAVVLPTGTLTLTDIPTYEDKRIYQRSTTSGGGQGKGVGNITLAISGALAGTINVRKIADDMTTVLQTFADVTIANGQTSILIAGVDAAYGWAHIQLRDSSGVWQTMSNAGTPMRFGMGALFGGMGQSLFERLMGIIEANGTFASLGITPDPCSAALVYYATYNPTPAIQAWMTPADYAANTGPNGVGLGELLNKLIALLGVNVGFVGAAVGGSAINTWLPGGTNVAKLTNLMSRAGGAFEGFFYGQGHGNSAHGLPPKAFQGGLEQFFANVVTPNNSFAGYGKYVWTIPTTRNNSWGSPYTYNRIDWGAELFCAANGAYHIFAPDIQQLDGIHETQTGGITLGRAMYRGARAYYAGNSSHLGPQLVSVSRVGTAVTFTFSDVGQTTLNQVGDFVKRIHAFPQGRVDRATNDNNRFPFVPGSFTIVNKTTATATLANDPGDGHVLDFWMYWMNGPSHASDNFYAESNNLYDNRTDGDGITTGRPIQRNFVPVICAAPSPGGTVNAPPGGYQAAVSPFNMTETSSVYGASYDAAFGNEMTSGRAAAFGNSTPQFAPVTAECWFTCPVISGTQIIMAGFFSTVNVNINSAGKLIANNGGLTGTTTLVAGCRYHVAFVAGPTGKAMFLTKLTDAVGAPITPVITREAQSLTPQTMIPIAGTAGVRSLGVSNVMAGGGVDEFAVFQSVRYDPTLTTYTCPTTPFTGTEADIVMLYHLDADAKDSIAA